MPELPEVETVRRGLEKLILGKTIQSVEVKYPKDDSDGSRCFCQDLPGQEIRAMGRRGKYLLFYLTDLVLISHLRMEGKVFLLSRRGSSSQACPCLLSFHRWWYSGL